ncbi:hypothetical protein ACQ4PT_022298 [Festuca glaucescens]
MQRQEQVDIYMDEIRENSSTNECWGLDDEAPAYSSSPSQGRDAPEEHQILHVEEHRVHLQMYKYDAANIPRYRLFNYEANIQDLLLESPLKFHTTSMPATATATSKDTSFAMLTSSLTSIAGVIRGCARPPTKATINMWTSGIEIAVKDCMMLLEHDEKMEQRCHLYGYIASEIYFNKQKYEHVLERIMNGRQVLRYELTELGSDANEDDALEMHEFVDHLVRVFDVVLNEQLSQVWDSFKGLVYSIVFGIMSGKLDCSPRSFVAVVFAAAQMLVLLILLCPLAAIYVFGLLISTGISLWRLIQHDYGRNLADEPNLKPALDTLYYLALLQGVLLGYRFLHARTQMKLAKEVIDHCDNKDELEIVSKYMGETRIGCEKDPSSARGRNLITYGVGLIGSKSPDDCLSGVQMLYTAILIMEGRLKDARVSAEERKRSKNANTRVHPHWLWILGQHLLLIKHLIVDAAPSSPVLQKLLEMLNPRGAYDREMRNQAVKIVTHLALDIHLEQFPRAIQYISTLIGMSFEEYQLIDPYNLLHKYDQDRDQQASPLASSGEDASNLGEDYEKLVLRGLRILGKLATDQENCRIISHTQGLLPKIMAPLTSDIIHQFNGCGWSTSLVEGSLKVMHLLVASPGETGAKLRREIWSNKEAIDTMERILRCDDTCCAELQKRTIGVLMQLYMDNHENREAFIEMLVDIFAGDTKDKSIRKLAGEALAKLCIQDGSNTRIILQVNGDVLRRLTKILVDDAEKKTCRIRAAEILEHMCVHHNQDHECLSKLKKTMTDTMPKVEKAKQDYTLSDLSDILKELKSMAIDIQWG